jgi:tetratricopeptide (TPR) repeat protein
VTAVPESGSLADVALPRLLLDLHRARFTGQLALSNAQSKKSDKTFALQDGTPSGSVSELPAERLGVVLEDTGILTRRHRDKLEAHIEQTGCKEAVALLQLGLVEPKELVAGIREQTKRRLVACFGWADGAFALTSGEVDDDLKPFRLDPYALIHAGLTTHWPLERMLADLQTAMERYATATKRLVGVARRLEVDATVERMIAGLNGSRTLGATMGSALSSPTVLAAFWVMDAASALDYSDLPRATGDAADTEIEIAVTGVDESSESTSTATERPAARAEEEPRAENPEAEKMRAEVLDRLERLDSLDFYELLGVERTAEHGAVRKAYFLAAKRYHPDAIARLGLQDIRTQAGEVFAKIAEANEVLSDAQRRNAYDRSLESGGTGEEIDVTIIAQAETFYRKGEILIKMGDFRGALEYLQNAVQLYPDEAVYQSDLAWAYYKKSPPEREPALEHIYKALELDPTDAVAQFRKGVIEGDTNG